MGAESAPHVGTKSEYTSEQLDKWYFLVGIKGKTLQIDHVQQQFEQNKVRIRGPYATEEILKYYHNGMLKPDHILFRAGDAEWKPFSKQNIVNGGIAESLKPLGVKKEVVSSLLDKITGFASTNKYVALALAVVALAGYFIHDYYYYKPEQVYGRIKDSVVLISTEDGFGKTTSIGSGFVISDDGIIATNLHVIRASATVKIRSGGGVSYDPVGVVYLDRRNDLALLKIRKKDQKTTVKRITLGTPQDIQVGETVYAVGSPAGLEFSLSQGIVSGKRNEDPISKESRELIQITAPLSPGNSGGPVLNQKGEVIGIATLASRNELQNLNFAVPISMLGDVGKRKELEYSFLPGNPRWEPVDLNLGGSDKDPDNGALYVKGSTYYNAETVLKHGEKVRTWVKVHLKPRPMTYEYRNAEVIGLVELNCRLKSFRFNILIGQLGDEDSESEANFSESNKWKSTEGDDNRFLDKLCENK